MEWAQGKAIALCEGCKAEATSMMLMPDNVPFCGDCWDAHLQGLRIDAEIEKKKCQMDAQSLKDEREYERDEIERFDW